MQKLLRLFYSVCLFLLASSCGKDDPPKAKVSINVLSTTVHEASIIEVEFILDKPASQNITINYDISGTASNSDYTVFSDNPGSIEIPAGETSVIEFISIDADTYNESAETLIVTILSIGGNVANIGTGEVTLTIPAIQNGLMIELTWDYNTPGDVDMDLFLWYEYDTDLFAIIGSSIFASVSESELVVIPNDAPDGVYGFTYNYYSGSADTLDFTVNFTPLVNGVPGSADSVNVRYTANNINPWDVSGEDIHIVQVATKNGSNFDFGDVVVPASGSKLNPEKLLKQKIFYRVRENK